MIQQTIDAANEIYKIIRTETNKRLGLKGKELDKCRLLIIFAFGEKDGWQEIAIGRGKLAEIWEAFTKFLAERYTEVLQGRLPYIE